MDIKEIPVDLISVKVDKISQPIDTKYGQTKKATVIYDGKEYDCWVKSKDWDKFTPGNILTGTLKHYQGKPYREWFVGGPTPLEKNDLPPSAQSTPVNLVGRGASFNLAFQFELKHNPTTNMQIFLDQVVKTADKITETQEAYVKSL